MHYCTAKSSILPSVVQLCPLSHVMIAPCLYHRGSDYDLRRGGIV
jgi:hypothetical protein